MLNGSIPTLKPDEPSWSILNTALTVKMVLCVARATQTSVCRQRRARSTSRGLPQSNSRVSTRARVWGVGGLVWFGLWRAVWCLLFRSEVSLLKYKMAVHSVDVYGRVCLCVTNRSICVINTAALWGGVTAASWSPVCVCVRVLPPLCMIKERFSLQIITVRNIHLLGWIYFNHRLNQLLPLTLFVIVFSTPHAVYIAPYCRVASGPTEQLQKCSRNPLYTIQQCKQTCLSMTHLKLQANHW